MKIRPTQSFRDKINEARRIFGTEDNDTTSICKRAQRYYKNVGFAYSKCNDKTVGNPVTINVETDLPPKEFQGLVIAYIDIQIEKDSSRIKRPLNLDPCENYIIKGE